MKIIQQYNELNVGNAKMQVVETVTSGITPEAVKWEAEKKKYAEMQESFAKGMRVRVPAASLEKNRETEVFVITHIRRTAAENGGNASLTVKSELTGKEKNINGTDVREIIPDLPTTISDDSARKITACFTIWYDVTL